MTDPHHAYFKAHPNSHRYAHPGSPGGSGGQGDFKLAGTLQGPVGPSAVPHPSAPAARDFDWDDLDKAIQRDHADSLWNRIQSTVDASKLLWIVRPYLDQSSFALGLIVGAAENLKDMAVALGSLVRTLALASLYDAAHSKATFALGPLGVARLQARAIEYLAGDALRKAHEERQKLLDELWHAVTNLRETLTSIGGQVSDSYKAKWDRLVHLHQDPALKARYEEGKITGEVLVDVIMLITTVIDGVGAVKALAELPELTKLARGLRTITRSTVRADEAAAKSAASVGKAERSAAAAGKEAESARTAGSAANKTESLASLRAGDIAAKRVLPGDPDKVAVIGRRMTGVRQFGDAMKENGMTPTLFDGDAISPAAKTEWAQLTAGGRTLSDEELMQTKMYQENLRWAQQLKAQGYTVVDVGAPADAGKSVFYEMEKSVIFGDGK